ncbi:MAG: ATPase domain-containing protein [Thermoplasmata archaeon]
MRLRVGKIQEAGDAIPARRTFFGTLVRGESTVSEESAPGLSVDRRVSTGSVGLDAMLEGGLVPRRPYLVVGPSGTGKTTLALQFLIEGVRHGERCLFVTLEEPPNELRVNHRGLGAELDDVEVFDAIPDIMRYERVPFKDIASVRAVTAFKHVPIAIRRSPELSAVEVTMTALEQMLRTEVVRRGYSRLVVDSLTALQYFCMKGYDSVAGAQAFLRFLSDLRVTTILTVESPLEDVETPERMLARGEVRLFRWELDERTVRAVGVEKFRGSPHDVRLHPYRIGSKGIDVNLEMTISRDTRQIIEPMRPTVVVPPTPTPIPLEEVISPVDPLAEQVRDLVLVGAEMGPVRTEIEAALGAAAAGDLDRSRAHLSRASALLIGIFASLKGVLPEPKGAGPEIAEAYQRIVQRGEAARAGLPPTKLPPPKVLEVQLEWVLSLIPPAIEPPTVPEAEEEEAPPVEAETTFTPTIPPTEPEPTVPAAEESAAPQEMSPTPEPALVAASEEPVAPLEEELETVEAGATPEVLPPSSLVEVPVTAEVESPPELPPPGSPMEEPVTAEVPAPSDVAPTTSPEEVPETVKTAMTPEVPPPSSPEPPGLSSDSVAPTAPPLRPWSAPSALAAPPPMPTSPTAASRVDHRASDTTSLPVPATAGSKDGPEEDRPPLPSIPSEFLVSSSHPAPAPIRPPPSHARATEPSPVVTPPPAAAHGVAPAAPHMAHAAGATSKRRRKSPTPARKKPSPAPTAPTAPAAAAPPPGEVTVPIGAVAPMTVATEIPVPPAAPAPGPAPTEAPPPPPKPKRRSPRKKKAPSVLTATPGAIPPGVIGAPSGEATTPPPAAEDERRTVSE